MDSKKQMKRYLSKWGVACKSLILNVAEGIGYVQKKRVEALMHTTSKQHVFSRVTLEINMIGVLKDMEDDSELLEFSSRLRPVLKLSRMQTGIQESLGG